MTVVMMTVAAVFAGGCGNAAGNSGSANLEGSCEEILTEIYDTAELSDDFRTAMTYFDTVSITEDMAEYLIGTAEVEYTDSVCSMPMTSSVAYQCILLRLAEGQDAEEAKQLIAEHADPDKWICVEAESVVVENVGDVVFFVMGDADTAAALRKAFLALD
jgi:hypothetical protein